MFAASMVCLMPSDVERKHNSDCDNGLGSISQDDDGCGNDKVTNTKLPVLWPI